MVKKYTRSKARYSSTRAAWMSLAKATGLKPSQVKPKHTMKSYVWVRK